MERAEDVAPPEQAGGLTVLYDGECGFCKVILATLLRWDRAQRLAPAPIQSTRGEQLLFAISPGDRLASWHLIDGACAVHSGGAGIPIVLAALPGGAPLAGATAQFPRATSRTYDWVASHRALLGRFFGGRARAWAARVIAEREQTNADGAALAPFPAASAGDLGT